jgi:hypothetical protein
MSQHPRRVLYVESYTSSPDTTVLPSSDSIGYGITSSRAIRNELKAMGYEIIRSRLPHEVSRHDTDAFPVDSAHIQRSIELPVYQRS